MSTFDSTKPLLPDILADIVKGKIQLPDFQRGWVWCRTPPSAWTDSIGWPRG